MEQNNVFSTIYRLVGQIPPGRVTTYGQVARLTGNPRWSRVVGYALRVAPEGLPCHRVVTREGLLSGAFRPLGQETHRLLLEMEGIPFREDGSVALDLCMWYGPE